MKQLLFMIGATLVGTAGCFTRGPVYGVIIYYFFAVLRPQYIWQWSLPEGIQWSQYVALATIASVALGGLGPSRAPRPRSAAHSALMLFASCVIASYLNGQDRDYGYNVFIDYLKIFVMFIIASVVLSDVVYVWTIMLLSAIAIAYIAYEINYLYFVRGTLKIQRDGYGGLDNNGAGLMLAMGVPLCLFAWEGVRNRLRWVFLALIPAIVHAVLMTYSRGAMLSLIVGWPLMIARSRYRSQIILVSVAFAVLAIPVLAGPEIQARFFTIKDNEVDESANSRRQSWAAAWAIAKDYPVLGVGVRNANLFSYQYGADVEGRTIHSQYLQIAADCGLLGLGLYLVTLGCVVGSTCQARRAAAADRGIDGDRVRAIASGVECSLAVFCFGAIFLSLEVFELPYLLMLLGAQLSVVYPARAADPSSNVRISPCI